MNTENPESWNTEEMELKLWEFIDGSMDREEKSSVEKLIEENQLWKSKYAELLEIHQSINFMELDEPSMRFTKNVMEEISRYQIAPATRSYINNRIIWGIGAFFIALMAGILVYGLAQINWAAGSDSSSTIGIDLGKIDFTRMFNNSLMNVLMMLNVMLGLFLLDRYLSGRLKKNMQKPA